MKFSRKYIILASKVDFQIDVNSGEQKITMLPGVYSFVNDGSRFKFLSTDGTALLNTDFNCSESDFFFHRHGALQNLSEIEEAIIYLSEQIDELQNNSGSTATDAETVAGGYSPLLLASTEKKLVVYRSDGSIVGTLLGESTSTKSLTGVYRYSGSYQEKILYSMINSYYNISGGIISSLAFGRINGFQIFMVHVDGDAQTVTIQYFASDGTLTNLVLSSTSTTLIPSYFCITRCTL